jgi:hypothetical protein
MCDVISHYCTFRANCLPEGGEEGQIMEEDCHMFVYVVSKYSAAGIYVVPNLA